MRRARNKRALPTSAPKTVTFARCTPQPTTTHSPKDVPSTEFVRRTRARTGSLPVPLTHARPASREAGRARKPTHFAIACGVGFEVYGFRKAGFDAVGMNDICPANARVLRRKYGADKVFEGDIHDENVVRKFPKTADIVTVAMQCQPSSTQNVTKKPGDTRHRTNSQMLRRAIDMNPRCILVENVRGFRTVNNGREFRKTINSLRRAMYKVNAYEINSKCWTPSSRPRLFILAHRTLGDPLRALEKRARQSRPRRMNEFFECTSMWRPVGVGGHGPDGVQSRRLSVGDALV